MKPIILAAILIAMATPASAQISSCRAIDNGQDRLACYDGLFAPSKPAVKGKAIKPTGYDEERDNEEARMKKVLGPICQNCGSSSKGGGSRTPARDDTLAWPEKPMQPQAR